MVNHPNRSTQSPLHPPLSAPSLNLHEETKALARKFRLEANRLDTIFTQTCDPRALQGGAICEDAETHREFARELFALAREIECP